MFLYVPFNAPHSPLQAPEEYLEKYRQIQPKKRRTFAAMVTCLDDAVGTIVAALDEAGQSENTLIVFTSDNGGPPGLGADNGLLRSGKGKLYEGGVRVPAIAHWPNVVPAGAKVGGVMHVVDLFPTLLAVAAATPEKSFEINGMNQWPVIIGGKPAVRREVLLNTTPFHGAVRVGDWKLIRNGHITANATEMEGEEKYELFNLSSDPYEKQDLAAENAEMLAKLKRRLQKHADAAVEPNIPPNRAPEDFEVPKVW
jgi:arylsulfatase A-like enzyme